MNEKLVELFRKTRNFTEDICKPLASHLFSIQPADFTSPPKWHLGHTTWFFEEFILRKFNSEYRPIDEQYRAFFNSYYKSQGDHWPRGARGSIEPTTEQVIDYRRYVDAHMIRLLSKKMNSEIEDRVVLGLHHEQQHQELLLMDIKYILNQTPGADPYKSQNSSATVSPVQLSFLPQEGGLLEVGTNQGTEFCFDNENPRFKYFQYPFALANRPVTNGEFLDFISDGGYSNPLLWKSDGWDHINSTKSFSPLYWKNIDGQWLEYTLSGEVRLDLNSPVCHVSYYEADAFAEWQGSRLPTEFELEVTYQSNPTTSGFSESNLMHPAMALSSNGFFGLTGNLWEWTASAYSPFPGYQRPKGAFGEYNQKFMVNQIVLKGGCIATPQSHFRPSYRNFFYPTQKWAFTGIRLAKDAQ